MIRVQVLIVDCCFPSCWQSNVAHAVEFYNFLPIRQPRSGQECAVEKAPG
jgi:hypothetical protein